MLFSHYSFCYQILMLITISIKSISLLRKCEPYRIFDSSSRHVDMYVGNIILLLDWLCTRKHLSGRKTYNLKFLEWLEIRMEPSHFIKNSANQIRNTFETFNRLQIVFNSANRSIQIPLKMVLCSRVKTSLNGFVRFGFRSVEWSGVEARK